MNIKLCSPTGIGPHPPQRMNTFKRLDQKQKLKNAKNLNNGPWDLIRINAGTHL
jgi:hypothetical protein